LRFNDIVGNNEIKEYLLKSAQTGNISQSYLFVGTDGIGKFLIAKEFAKKILCSNDEKLDYCDCKSCKCFAGFNHTDFSIVNEEGTTIKIEQIREITNKVIEQPIVSNKKIYIINDCEKMTVEAQNCLLKTLEEPPEFIVIVLISSRENLIIDTIKSRCTIVKFKNISNDELKKYAVDNLGYTQMTDNLLETFNGSIGQAIKQKENQEKFIKINSIIDDLLTQDIISIMNNAKFIYDKENIYDLLDYMTVCTYKKISENKIYLDCVQKIEKCKERLKCNCNFDMCIDTMLFEIWECVRKGM